ncbi:hypothetical protein C8A01DRAFT_38317 [Parachaetomium inaequale]|uniref:RNase T2-like C-terminal domain-containing protein n=1 Tax=Parachaetomium inaequale TaxID=2588326 RepID=A0AAN6PD03_9PEZI|nr:hypothetical protein C8A01DRAFT_38317 [Parachaetomium inaequale]
MRPHALVTLALTSLTTAAAIPTSSPPRSPPSFTGKGQLRALWNQGDHADLGCLTATGLWTADDSLCGTFTAAKLDTSSLPTYTLTSAAGPCHIYGARFECGQGYQGYEFGIWPFPNSIPGKDCLRYGQYGLMGSSGQGGPPASGDPAVDIHFVSYSEKGKYVWLTWAAVEE